MYVAVAAVIHSRAWMVDSMKMIGFFWKMKKIWIVIGIFKNSPFFFKYSSWIGWKFDCSDGPFLVRFTNIVIRQLIRILC